MKPSVPEVGAVTPVRFLRVWPAALEKEAVAFPPGNSWQKFALNAGHALPARLTSPSPANTPAH